ncbi:MAG: hypothetical protein H0V17_32740, partial [Deltaproteobacteria bacterium]|nr:hypothetical protein [Deltaproteobacteria bacterium]
MIRLVVLCSVLGLGVGCTDQSSGRASTELLNGPSSTVTFNALTGNALTGNALTGNALTGNALTGNALTGNALTGNALTGNGLTDGQMNREFFRYVYGCAARADQHILVTLDGQEHRFDGAIGLAPEWMSPVSEGGTGKCDHQCQRWVTACVLARTNAFGVPVPISIRGNHPALSNIGPDELAQFPLREGSYYGNIFGGSLYGDDGRYACTGPASNEPSQTARLCSNGGTEPVSTPCSIVIDDECFVPAAEHFTDPALTFGTTTSQCTTQGANGQISGCSLNELTVDEVITVFLKAPVAKAGNAVCETGETSATTSDCGDGWAKLLADPYLVTPTGGVAVDGEDNVITAGTTTGGPPDFGGGPINAGGAFWLAKFDRNGNHKMSLGIGAGTARPVLVASDATNIYVLGSISSGHVGGDTLAPGTFLAKYSATGTHLWSKLVPAASWRMIVASNGNVLVGGTAGNDSAVFELASVNGEVVSTRTNAGGGTAGNFALDPNGNLLIGDRHGLSLVLPSGERAWSIKEPGLLAIDTTGHFYLTTKQGVSKFGYSRAAATLEWHQAMDLNGGFGREEELIFEARVGRDGNLVIGGSHGGGFSLGMLFFRPFTPNIVFDRGFVIKLRPDGTVLWGEEMVTSIRSPLHGFALDSNSHVAVVGMFEGNVVVDGVSLLSPRQSQQQTSTEMYIGKIGDHVVAGQPNDRVGGAVPIVGLGDGLQIEYFDELDFQVPIATTIVRDAELPIEIPVSGDFSVRWTGTLTSDITDVVAFELLSGGTSAKLFIDGVLVIDDSVPHTVRKLGGSFGMTGNKRHDIRIEYQH